ncbi:MAG TPA: hypothetical protein VK070_07840 [Acidimicrobiia bacterium]|nr:hypothetical protein [Acidimicrobiia bacterium]
MSDLTDSTLFKALDGLRPMHGDGRYPGVGRWTRHLDPQQLQPCAYGYHLTRGPQVFGWLGPTLYVAEACPDHDLVAADDKLVTCRVRLVRRLDRWDETTARLFAADCAEAVLLGERASGREPDERSWAAVEAARAFTRGEISRVEAEAAATAATAAWAAAVAAAGAATETTAAASVAAAAAGAAAEAASWDAVEAAAWAAANAARAAGDAARAATYRRFCAYLEGGPIPPVEPLYRKETPDE